MAQIEAFFAQVRERFGRLDILVNNAAANPYYGPIQDTPLDAFQKTVDVNIRGYFFMSSAAVKLMAENGGGAIVNTASINGVIPAPLQGIYSITKAAVISMTKAYARECAPLKVRVNALLPGLTDTRFAGGRRFARARLTGCSSRIRRCSATPSPTRWPAPCCIWFRTHRATRPGPASMSMAGI
jgi:NAD(P)-dependent dehydrogenase (short-subunit alcohol dehydrogenase family)